MKTHNIPLESFTPKSKTKVKIENEGLYIPAEIKSNGKERHYVYIPGKYKLPFRINMTAKIGFIAEPPSQFTLIIGKGNVYFNGGYTESCDILTGSKITPDAVYYNDIPSKEYVDISVMYGSKVMWAAVDGEYCLSSEESEYMKLLHDNTVPDKFINGLDIAICGGTGTKLEIKSLTIIEYENDELEIPAEISNVPELSPFEWYVKGLPLELQDEMIKTDEFLLNDMKKILKFKRAIDKYGHLTYKSPCGFQYTIFEHGAGEFHEINWDWMKKPDYTDAVLVKLAESSPEFADKMFSRLWDCGSPTCKRVSINEYNGKTKITCRSTIVFKWLPAEFEDVRKVAAAANEVVKAAADK